MPHGLIAFLCFPIIIITHTYFPRFEMRKQRLRVLKEFVKVETVTLLGSYMFQLRAVNFKALALLPNSSQNGIF